MTEQPPKDTTGPAEGAYGGTRGAYGGASGPYGAGFGGAAPGGGSRFLDDLARLMTDAAGVAQGARREVETVMRSQAERFAQNLDLVSREEFDAVKEMAARARSENESLRTELEALKTRLDDMEPAKPAPKPRAKARKAD